ncbi:MAG: glycoside hydrolase family 130 protein [Armatimonadota bacterium]|nr:glycoside hydrolase family 130 protein [Armatimonadota bacterium]
MAAMRRVGIEYRPLGRDIVHRWEGNPIITVEDIPFRCNSVFNAAAAMYGDEYILLLRVEDLGGRSVFALARGYDGFHFNVEPTPAMEPSDVEPFQTYERRGIEDPRITEIDGVYYIMYTAYSQYGPCLALAKTPDFKTFTRIGIISEPENKDGALFPKKIGGRYARLDRPHAGLGNIWVSYSEDLKMWGDSQVVMTGIGGRWDCDRIGASTPPIETPEGWLEIYHGVKCTSGGPVYRLGVALLDLEDPSKVIKRSMTPILSPREYYERIGDVGNVVFSCGAIPSGHNGNLMVYYGAGDTCICVGTTTIDELVSRCMEACPEG